MKLRLEKENFFLSILTLDTHYPDGHSNEYCKNNLDENYYKKIECASILVKNFVDFLYEENFFIDTNVVIVADHLSWGLNADKNCRN